MNTIQNSQEEKWVVCHNGVDIFHVVNVKIGGNLSSGQPIMETFDTEKQAVSRVTEMKPDFKYKK